MRMSLLALFVVLAALVGYALAPGSVRAESTPAFSYGQTLILTWQDGRGQERCSVHRQAGDFVACANQRSTVGDGTTTVWYNLRFIERAEEARTR